MKFDLDTAWKDTMGLLSRNIGLLAVLAGVFFFLPYAGFMIAVPEMGTMQSAQASGDFDVVMAAVTELYLEYWWVFLLLALIQGVGLLGMLALVRRRANPTVGEALATGARSSCHQWGCGATSRASGACRRRRCKRAFCTL